MKKLLKCIFEELYAVSKDNFPEDKAKSELYEEYISDFIKEVKSDPEAMAMVIGVNKWHVENPGVELDLNF